MKKICSFILIITILCAGLLTGCAGFSDQGAGNETKQVQSAAESPGNDAESPGSDVENLESDAESPGSGSESYEGIAEEAPNEKDEEVTMNVLINGRTYTAILDSGLAASELKNMLPLTLNMRELNGNEKYGDLPEALTQDTFSPGEIHTGDILLWGSDTLVIFYKDFPTQYSYTKIGSIADAEGLSDVVGSGNVEVSFQ